MDLQMIGLANNPRVKCSTEQSVSLTLVIHSQVWVIVEDWKRVHSTRAPVISGPKDRARAERAVQKPAMKKKFIMGRRHDRNTDYWRHSEFSVSIQKHWSQTKTRSKHWLLTSNTLSLLSVFKSTYLRQTAEDTIETLLLLTTLWVLCDRNTDYRQVILWVLCQSSKALILSPAGVENWNFVTNPDLFASQIKATSVAS